MTARHGMTLFELTVALAVSSVTLALGGSALSTLADHRASTLAAADADERALAARLLVSDWLTAVRVGPDAEFTATRRDRRTSTGALADDSLSFVTAAGGSSQRIHLFVDRRGASSALVALVSDHGRRARIVLADSIAGIEAQFLSAAFGARAWHRGWQGALRPSAVTLYLRASDGVALPVALRLPVTIVLATAP